MLHICSCIIELIELDVKKRLNVRLAKHFVSFHDNFNRFYNTGALMKEPLYLKAAII